MPQDRVYSQADIDSVVGVNELRVLIGLGSRGGAVVTRSYVEQVVERNRFPQPLISYPPEGRLQLRLWLLDDVVQWMDRIRPSWRDRLPTGRQDWSTAELSAYIRSHVADLAASP